MSQNIEQKLSENYPTLSPLEESILAQLSINVQLSNQEACKQFSVSRMTIYRAFRKLENLGYASLERGLARIKNTERDFSAKVFLHNAQKRKIAAWAVNHLVPPLSTLILEAGTTVAYTLEYLENKKPSALMSNGIDTLKLAMQHLKQTEILGSGGVLRSRAQSFVGNEAHEFFRTHYADIALLSATTCDLQQGYMDINKLEAEIKTVMMQHARKLIMLVDSSKLGRLSVSKFAAIDAVDTLVTDSDADPNFITALEKLGVECYAV